MLGSRSGFISVTSDMGVEADGTKAGQAGMRQGKDKNYLVSKAGDSSLAEHAIVVVNDLRHFCRKTINPAAFGSMEWALVNNTSPGVGSNYSAAMACCRSFAQPRMVSQ